MAKKPNKKANKKAISDAFDEKHGKNKAARGIPVSKGDKFEFRCDSQETLDALFVQRDEQINGNDCSWVDVQCVDGSAISATQLTRRNNGLPLSGKLISERIESFLNLFDDNGVLILRVADVRTKAFTQKDGSVSTSSYYIFEILTGNVPEEEEEEEEEDE